MTNPLYLVDKCLHQGLLKLAEALQYYWPAALVTAHGEQKGYLHEIAENNIALQLARSFGAHGFQVWAEIPFGRQEGSGERRRLDFLAYQYELETLVALELKNSLETPQKNIEDVQRLVLIAHNGLIDEDHGFNYNRGLISDCPNRFYGLVTIMNDQAFADWWAAPKDNDYTPQGRKKEAYSPLGRALDKADSKATVPLIEYSGLASDQAAYRFRRAGYALYTAATMKTLGAPNQR
jgi:hypothetical protein